jgi:hypothetical protein
MRCRAPIWLFEIYNALLEHIRSYQLLLLLLYTKLILMLEPPSHFLSSFVLAFGVCLAIGLYYSIPIVWNSYFPKGNYDLYIKVGEYGITYFIPYYLKT